MITATAVLAFFLRVGPAGPILQVQCNTIVGRVTMEDARLLSAATVTAKNTETKKVVEATSNNKGEYNLCLLLGKYDFSATSSGFRGEQRKSLHIDLVHDRAVDFVLKFTQR